MKPSRLLVVLVPLLLARPGSASTAPDPGAPVVAVFNVEVKGLRMAPDVLDRMSDLLTGRIAATGRFQVVPRDRLKERLVAAKKTSYKDCYAQSCQIELGQELAAQKTLATQVVKLGSTCTITINIFDLARAASEGGATARGGCSEDEIVSSLEEVVNRLAAAAPGGPGPQADDAAPSAVPAPRPAAKPAQVPPAEPDAPEPAPERPRSRDAPREEAPGKVLMELFVMSKCPFASQVEQALAPALRKLGRAVDLRMEFIGDEPQPGELTSMHGDGEVRGDLLYVCTRQYAPERLLDLAVCMDRDLKQIPENFNACAADTGVPAATIRRCAEGEEGRRLLSASFRAAKDRGVRGSPTIYIAGERYQGGRTELDFRRGLCQALGEDGPKTCQDIPEPLAIDLTILTDARCKDCNPDRVQGQLKNMFPGLRPRTVDFGTPEGRALFRVTSAAGAGKLPQFLFGPNVVDDPGFGQIQRFIKDAGPYKLLEIGAKFDPLAEICDNGEDDDANGRVDCADPGCQEKLACRPEQPERLDLFMMSQCPFAAKAVLALREVLPRLRNAVDLRIHFIVDDTPTGFKSLHGQAEVDESLREVCVLDAYPKNFQYLEYFSCRSEDVRSTDWQRCARNGISAAVIDQCVASGRAAKLLRKNLEFAKTLDVGASPTWFVNNRHQATGVTAEAILKAYCEHNPDADGCP